MEQEEPQRLKLKMMDYQRLVVTVENMVFTQDPTY